MSKLRGDRGLGEGISALKKEMADAIGKRIIDLLKIDMRAPTTIRLLLLRNGSLRIVKEEEGRR
jgi:hypothetical protein